MAAWRTVGGSATPAARSARLAAGRGAERSRKRCKHAVSNAETMLREDCRPRPMTKADLLQGVQ
jgi:hypothetical protein